VSKLPGEVHMLQAGDKVQEIATGLQGVIKMTHSDGSKGNGIITALDVEFVNGTRKTFYDESELKSLMEPPEAGFSPAEPLQK
jgi:hypothetical protein